MVGEDSETDLQSCSVLAYPMFSFEKLNRTFHQIIISLKNIFPNSLQFYQTDFLKTLL